MEEQLLQYPEHKIFGRRYETGAKQSAKEGGISVVIDVFRASNTMLELLTAGAEVAPVTSVEDALEPKFEGYTRVGEDYGEELINFHYDNSPVLISENYPKFKDKKVVIRTTNGTRGIIASIGSKEIIVGTFRNFSAVVKHCVKANSQGIPVSFISMGTLETSRIEDDYCANMFVTRMLEEQGLSKELEILNKSNNNLWETDWRKSIMDSRGGTHKEDDYHFSLQLDTTEIVPIYNVDTGFLELR